MSNNQKQTSAGGPQTQRFTPSPYTYLGPEGYPVSTPPGPYVPSQQPNQGGNQGPGLRGITPTVPPNQASTPPNADLKVQPLQQHMFVQPPVRPAQGTYYRTNGPPSQGQRMSNHNRPQQQPLYTPQPSPYMHVSPMYIPTPNTMAYPTGFPAQRPPGYLQTVPTQIYTPHLSAAAFNHFSGTPAQAQPVQYYNFGQVMQQRAPGSIQQVSPMNATPSQAPLQNVSLPQNGPPLQQPFQQQQQQQRQVHKRRPNALKIIDPNTGADRLQEIFDDAAASSHPPSGESSARQTPQPPPAQQTHNKEVQAAFAKQVLQAINKDALDLPVPMRLEDTDHEERFATPPPQSTTLMSKFEHVAQSSKLQPGAKEFVLNTNTAKETPIVSANVDSAEVTLPNKLPKDRESPVKGGRKPREQAQQLQQQQQQQPQVVLQQEIHPREQRDSAKETTPLRNSVSDKEASIVKDEVKPVPEPTPVAVISSPSPPVQAVVAPAKENQISEKKTQQKKDSKAEQKAAKSVEKFEPPPPAAVAAVPVPAPVQQLPTPPAQDVNVNSAKKQNASRAASKQQQQQQQSASHNNNHKQAAAAAPTPQPAKPAGGGKAHKKNELNQKGANKEGTDMDAFNDNVAKVEINANVTTAPAPIPSPPRTNDINANSVPEMETTPVAKPDINVNVPAKKPEIEEIKPTAVTKPLPEPVVAPSKPALAPSKPVKSNPKFDITSIVTEKPKNIKPFISTVESHDETDRARAVSNDRLSQAKNDAGAKNDISKLDPRLNTRLPYREGQWSPANPSGLKVYQRDFLMALRDSPASRKVPENIPDVILADERGGLSDGRSSMGGRSSDFAPNYNNYGSRSNSLRGAIPKRGSQSKAGPSGKPKQPAMKVSLSVKGDVKLNEVENAWRPARLNRGENATSEDKKTEELYKRVRGVLNRLTPQKMDTLISQVKSFQIDTLERLQGVIDLCFDKAVDEPSYAVAYACLCNQLGLLQVPTSESTSERPEFVNFRKCLVTRCQLEFEKQSVNETGRNKILKQIEECTDPDKMKDLQFELEEHDRKLRMRSVGTIRFIGELFKQKMLTVNIMMRCLSILLENRDEESLECLCKLMTTIGKELETNNVSLNQIFSSLKVIVENKQQPKVSSRIRFMIQDVIDLRQSKWVPRRQDVNPKTIDQIQKEAETEQMNIQMMNSMPPPSRKDDRSNQGNQNDRRGGRGVRNNMSDDGGWTTMNNSRNRNQFSVQTDKLKSKAPATEEPLGNPLMFGAWGKGSVGSNNKVPASHSPNMYAALENIDMDKRGMNIRIGGNKDPYHSKGPSLERNYNKYDGRGSRSGSQHRSNDNSGPSSQRSTPAPSFAPPALQKPVAAPPAPAETPKMTEEQIERRISNSLEEYINGNCSVGEYFEEISEIPASYMSRVVCDSFFYVIEKKQHYRLKTGLLFANLLRSEKIQLNDYINGLKEVLPQADDLKIDIPKIWDCLAELLVDVICEEVLPLRELHSCCHVLIEQKQADKLLAPLFKLVVSRKGPMFLSSIWKQSNLRVEDFVSDNVAAGFIQDNQLEFLVGGKIKMSFEEMQEALCKVISTSSEIDSISNWISSNIEGQLKENTFIRALATAITIVSLDNKSKLSLSKLTAFQKLITLYVDNDSNKEMQYLYAIQTLINKMEHPQGLLLHICNGLYDMGVISEESFLAWEKDEDPAEQAGKGVALKQLTSFFTQLKENDEDEEDEGSASGN